MEKKNSSTDFTQWKALLKNTLENPKINEELKAFTKELEEIVKTKSGE